MEAAGTLTPDLQPPELRISGPVRAICYGGLATPELGPQPREEDERHSESKMLAQCDADKL